MDSFADLIPVAIVVGYLFVKLAGRSRRLEAPTAKRPPARPAGRAPAGATPFEQLLARLEEANASPSPRPLPPVQPLPVQPPPVQARRPESTMASESRRAVADYEARTAAATAFRTVDDGRGFAEETAGYDHNRHGFGPQNPLSEPAFEAGSGADRRPAQPGRQSYDPHGLRTAPRPAAGQSIVDRLSSPSALRDAFVLQTILSRRPALRRPR